MSRTATVDRAAEEREEYEAAKEAFNREALAVRDGCGSADRLQACKVRFREAERAAIKVEAVVAATYDDLR